MTDWVRAEVVPADWGERVLRETYNRTGGGDLGGDEALERAACGGREHFG